MQSRFARALLVSAVAAGLCVASPASAQGKRTKKSTTTAAPAAAATPAAAAQAAPSSSAMEVLGLDSSDAEEEADALTVALRVVLRRLPGVEAGSSTQTLNLMTTANKCPQAPQEPDDGCLEEIGKQLKSKNYVWGLVRKDGADMLVADLRLYREGGSPKKLSLRYPANLRDGHDEALQKQASRALVELLDVKAGFVRVTDGTKECGVLVDGKLAGSLEKGGALLETTPGKHVISTEAPCEPFEASVEVPVSGEVGLSLASKPAPKYTAPPPKPFFTPRRAVATGLVAGGVVSGVVGAVFFGKYLSTGSYARDEANASQTRSDNVQDHCNSPDTRSKNVCDADSRAKTQSAVAIATGALGVGLITAGVVLWVTEPKREERTGQQKPSWQLSPMVGRDNGLLMSGTF